MEIENKDLYLINLNQDEIEKLKNKELAMNAGLMVELEPYEAEALGVDFFFDEVKKNEEEILLNSRFDACEFNLEEIKNSLTK